MRRFFADDDFNFLTQIALGSVYRQAADIREVLSSTQGVSDGDAHSWVEQWTATADRIAGEAAANVAAGHHHSAGAQYLRASNYYSFATYSADGTGAHGRFVALWEKHRHAWDRFIDLADHGRVAVERIEIPYEDTTLPGYFFRSGAADQPQRTLIFNNGSDGSIIDAWGGGIAAALDRGWNAMTFDGPDRTPRWSVRDWVSVMTGST